VIIEALKILIQQEPRALWTRIVRRLKEGNQYMQYFLALEKLEEDIKGGEVNLKGIC
jgi:hypothetical protein